MVAVIIGMDPHRRSVIPANGRSKGTCPYRFLLPGAH
jgi:hypothetical protein